MAMAAGPPDVIDSLSKEFECSICMERLRNPKCLFCLHTFCLACLESYAQSGRESANQITCPVCRVVTRLRRDGVAGLKSNTVINSVLGKLDEWEKTKNRGSNAKGQGSKPCEGGKHHSLTASGSDAAQYCEVHDGKLAKYYCCQCDKLYCHTCKQSSHKTIPLHQKASSVRSLMQGLVDRCNDKNIRIQTFHHKVNVTREYVMENLPKSMEEVRQKAAKVVSKVRDKEEELLQYLEGIKQRAVGEMEERQEKCSSLEDGLQAIVTEWQTLRSSSDAEMVRKFGSIEKKMNELLKAFVDPSTPLSRALQYGGLQFIPGKLYLEASCEGSELGEFSAKPDWDPWPNVAARYDSVSQLMYMPNGTLLIADPSKGIDSVSRDDDPKITTPVQGQIVRDLTVLADGTIFYQNNDKEIIKRVDNTSKKIGRYGGNWVSVTCCPSDGHDLIVVANQNHHDQEILFMDTLGNVVDTVHTDYVGGIRHLRFDKCRNAIFIDQNRRCVRCQRLSSDDEPHQIFVLAEENTIYLSVSCNRSNFLYVASQKASAPNVVTIKQHSLTDGSLQATLVSDEQVPNSFRMVIANWKDKSLAYVVGNKVSVITGSLDADVTTPLQLPNPDVEDEEELYDYEPTYPEFLFHFNSLLHVQ